MNKNIKNIFLIIAFLMTITVPQISFMFMNRDNETISLSEKRKLHSKPELKLSTIKSYSRDFENYYNDHLPFRTELRELWANLNHKLFNTTINTNVIIGKENWLFLRAEQSIERIQGYVRYTEKEKEEILSNIQHNIDTLKEQKIETYVLITPSKENIYKEKLPSSVKIVSDTTKAEDLIKYIKNNSDINIIYPEDELMFAKSKYKIYKKYDTHWNTIGGLIGTICLQKAIDIKFTYNLDDIEVEELEVKDANDLSLLAGLDRKMFENMLRIKNFYPQIKYEKVKNNIYEEYSSNSENKQTVLCIGDSFLNSMKEHFSKLYQKVIYINIKEYTKDLIEIIKPDIVIIEATERKIDNLKENIV